MSELRDQFRTYFDHFSAAALLAITKARGLNTAARKLEMLGAIMKVYDDKTSLVAALASLDGSARILLAVLKQKNGEMKVSQLRDAAAKLGINNVDMAISLLMRNGLLVYTENHSSKRDLWHPHTPSTMLEEVSAYTVVTVPGLLQLVDVDLNLLLPTHQLTALSAPPYSIREQSQSVLLHGLFTVVRRAGEKPFTITRTNSAIAKNDLKAVAKQLGGDLDWTQFLCSLARSAKLLVLANQELKVSPKSVEFFARAPRDQVRVLFDAWLELKDWSEFFRIAEVDTDLTVVPDAYNYSDVPNAEDLHRARKVLTKTLQAQRPDGWTSLASLIGLLKTESVEFLVTRTRKNRRWYGSNNEHYDGFWKKGQSPWLGRFNKKTEWELVEGRFIRQVLDEPLRWLGIVETGKNASGEIMAFRLTPLGAYILGLAPAPEEEEKPVTKPLIVQPNFEIIAYTEPEHLKTLYELERFAERVSADRVAHYRLTRDAVYRGLQDGLTADDMREFLVTHSQNAVPQNIAYSLDDWGRLFDRVAIHRSAALVEAANEIEMDALLSALPQDAAERLAPLWVLVDGRYLDLARAELAKHNDAVTLDYRLEVSRAFTVEPASQGKHATLQIEVPRENMDLWLQARLEQFADPVKEKKAAANSPAQFTITRESVARAAALRIDHTEILRFLETRGTLPLPADVTLTLRGWGGEIEPVALSNVVALVTEQGLMPHIAAVDELRKLLWLRVDERCALVRAEDVAKLQSELEKRGIAASAGFDERLNTHGKPRTAKPASTYLPANRRVGAPKKQSHTTREVAASPKLGDIELQVGLSAKQLEITLNVAIVNANCVVIDYQGKARQSLRKIAGLELVKEDGYLYLHAWDYWREDYRVFRLDRVRGVAVLEEEFDPDEYNY